MLRTAAWLLAALVLLFTGVMGLYNGVTEWPGAAAVLGMLVAAAVRGVVRSAVPASLPNDASR